MSALSIGIDLGSHWTKAGIIEEGSGQFRMIYKMRSVFAFDQDQSEVPTFGEEALKSESYKIIADANRDQKFAANKRDFDETSYFASVPFRCYADYDWKNQGSYDLALINDASNGDGAKATTFAVGQQAIIAAILAHLKAEVMKQFKSCQECLAIIAVPSFAGDNHRRVILEAAQLAGCFTSVQLLNQTTAALIAYNFDQQQAERECGNNNGKKQASVEHQQFIGLICFGANSFECSLFHPFDVSNSSFSPKLVEIVGSNAFGSSSFTDRLAQWCLTQIDPDDGNGNKLGMNVRKQIWEKCEEAKKRLSEQESTTIALHYHDVGKGLKAVNLDIQRSDFERLCQPLLGKLGQLVIKRIFGPNRGRIGHLLLTGGGSRMPALMQMVEPYLVENCVKVEDNHVTALGEWVVKGVAIKAAEVGKSRSLAESKKAPFADLLYREVDLAFPMAGVLQQLFKPKMQIPTDEAQFFKYDFGRESVEFLFDEDGLQIGKFVVSNNADAEDGDFNQIAFRIDVNGLLRARFHTFNGEYKEVINCIDWPNLYGMDGLNRLREELTNLSILPRANANSNDRVEEEDRSAPNIGKKMAELINLLDKKEPNGRANGVNVGQNAFQESSSTRSFANATSGRQASQQVKKNEANFPPLALAPAMSSSSKEEVEVSSQLANRIYLHCQDVMGDIAKLNSSKLYFDLGHWKLGDIYAGLSKSQCQSWPLYEDFLAEAETVRAKHWAHQNCQQVLQIVRKNQWKWKKLYGPSPSPFRQGFMPYQLEHDFLSKLAQCAGHEMVNGLYMEFVNEMRKEQKHEDFEEAQELMHLMGDTYTCHYQQIGRE